jgi:hypothetical protein
MEAHRDETGEAVGVDSISPSYCVLRPRGVSGVTFTESSPAAWTFTASLSIPALESAPRRRQGTPPRRRVR